jgi:hypothetical protein
MKLEFPRLFGKNVARQIVAERVLLPVDEMLFRLDLNEYERIGVRLWDAGRRRTMCGDTDTGRSQRYSVL